VTGERLLIVEDDDLISSSLRRVLESEGYKVVGAASGAEALDLWGDADLVLLDLGLPDLDGLEICRDIRAVDSTIPIIILTARDTEIDKVVGLDAGAVDYITKPFGLAELLARLRAHLRHVPPPLESDSFLQAGDVRVDLASRRVWVDGNEVALRVKEFDLLTVLMTNAGRVMTRERLMSEVWDDGWIGSTKTLDVHMASLRRKLGEGPGHPSRISTLRGVGHRFETA
jgi:DNA-binding response OmpR family regulator